MPYPLSRYLVAPILKFFIRSVTGTEHIPQQGSCILACRHTGPLDGLFIAAGIIPHINRKIHFIANTGRWGWLWRRFRFFTERWAGSIPFDKNNPRACLDQAMEYLHRGEIVGIFPSGLLQHQDPRKPGKTGTARLALWSKVPVIPIGLYNHFALRRREMVLKQLRNPHTLRITVGESMTFPDAYAAPVTYDLLRDITSRITRRIDELSVV